MRFKVTLVSYLTLFILNFGFLLFLSGCHSHSEAAKIAKREVQIKKLLMLGDLKPKIKRNFNSGMYRNFDIDENGNFYFLDSDKNGVFVFTPEGKFVRQIGSFGKDDSGLFQTNGMRIRNGKLFINNDNGKQIKTFSLDGKFLHQIHFMKSGKSVKNIVDGNWIDIHDSTYYTVLKAAYQNYNDLKLFHLFLDERGHVKQFGRLIKCRNIYGYRIFNACMFSIRNDNIIGSFLFEPIVFRYKLNGKEVFYKDLRNIGLGEIVARDKYAKQIGSDRPGKILSEGTKIMMVQYCRGFDVDSSLHSYYAVATRNFPPCVYHFDENGELVERLVLKNGNDIVDAESIIIADKSGKRYGIGFLSNEQTNKSTSKVLFSF